MSDYQHLLSEFFINSKKIEILYLLNEKKELHHPELPALILRDKNNECHYFYLNGILTRKNAPSFINNEINIQKPKKIKETFHELAELKKDAKKITEDNIMSLSLSADLLLIENIILSLSNSPVHREAGPAVINYGPFITNSLIERKEYYYHNEKVHREDGPAIIFYQKNSNRDKIIEEQWWLEGKLI